VIGRRRQRPLLGTFVEIATRAGGPLADAAITKAFEAIALIHGLASFQDPESELSRLNGAEGDAIALHPLLYRVLRLACAMTRTSGDLFNCTVGGALIGKGILPNHGRQDVREVGTSEDIELREGKARLRNRVQVTLDGIAKGFAVDAAVLVLKRHGISAGWINAGGDMRAFGDVTVPIVLRLLDNRLQPLSGLKNAALATSRVAATHDPRFPGMIAAYADRSPEIGTWSVVAAQAWRADALTKVAALAPPASRQALLARLRGRLVRQETPSQ
jgi:FAD:protein FMN transferase